VSATGTIAAEPNTCRSDPRRVFPLPSGGAVLLESSEGMTTHLDGKRIAIVKMSAIGDVVEVLPVVRSIRAAAPDAHLTWIIQRVPHELVAPIGAADEFILFDRGGGLGAYRDLRRRTRDRRWDIVLDLQVALKAGIATAMLRAPRKIGFDRARSSDLNWLFTNERIPARPPAHRQDQYLEFVDHLGIPRVVNWGLGSTPAEREAFAGLLPADTRPTVGLVLASTGEDRQGSGTPLGRRRDRPARRRDRPHLLVVQGRGYHVDAVANGDDALELLRLAPYDLVLLDEQMPGLSGMEVFDELRRLDPLVPVVMVTKSEEDQTMTEAIGRRVADYLVKPTSPRQVLSVVTRLLEGDSASSSSTSRASSRRFRELNAPCDGAARLARVGGDLLRAGRLGAAPARGRRDGAARLARDAARRLASGVRALRLAALRRLGQWRCGRSAALSTDVVPRFLLPLLGRSTPRCSSW
jgi:CheY-like chemotaxis protein